MWQAGFCLSDGRYSLAVTPKRLASDAAIAARPFNPVDSSARAALAAGYSRPSDAAALTRSNVRWLMPVSRDIGAPHSLPKSRSPMSATD